MNEHNIDAAPDPAREVVALLRAAQAWQLTAEQSADLNDILTDLEQAVRRSRLDHAMLMRLNGDVKVLDATATREPAGLPAGVAVAPLTRTQRYRIRRVLAALTANRRRGFTGTWRLGVRTRR